MTFSKAAMLAAVATAGLLRLGSGAFAADDRTIVDDWASIKLPAPLQLKQVTIDPKTTAFLVLDVVNQICKPTRQRCIATVPRIKGFLDQARAHGMHVVYTLGGGATRKDVVADLAPKDGEPSFFAHADKFIGTDLEKTLAGMNVKTLVIVGVATEGAVLYTASHAAFLGYKIVTPIDGSSSDTEFAEAAAFWTLSHAPGVGANTTLTKFSQIAW
jgi:nicotinamidase-related amidase